MKSTAMNPQSGPARPDAADDDAQHRRWLAATAQGDRRAFESLYLDQRRRLVGFLRRNTGRHELIDEIVNETFWVVWRNAARFRGDSRVSTWIVGIAYRCMLKALRRHGEPVSVQPEDFDAALESAATDASINGNERRELHDWVARGLQQLPREQRTAIELAYYYGQSCSEIAAVMGCATGTVKAYLFHARTRLRNVLPALGGETAAPLRSGQR
jgi:RNA polymerase sigma-70 factor (ECF subfamily)